MINKTNTFFFFVLKTWKCGVRETSWTIKSHICVIEESTSYNSIHIHIKFIIIWSNFYNDVFSMIASAMWTEKPAKFPWCKFCFIRNLQSSYHRISGKKCLCFFLKQCLKIYKALFLSMTYQNMQNIAENWTIT